MSYHTKTQDAAKGKWRGILLELGLPADALTGKHAACPMCGGVDRFRFDNRDGSGSYICGQCGAGNGMALAMSYTGDTFAQVAARVDALIGNITADTIRPAMQPADRLALLRDAYRATRAIVPGDLAHTYLTARGIGEVIYPAALRFAPAMRDGDGGVRPCMVAMIGVWGHEKPASMHRTFLRPDGLAKAEMAQPRKLMPGELPDGACVMLSDFHGGPIGIAEGIETAMSASALYSLPVWAALSSGMLAKWSPPEAADEIHVFSDNDPKFGGQAAAYALAHRLAVKGKAVTVHAPEMVGKDFNDVLLRTAK